MRRIDLRKVQAANPHTIRDINRQIVPNYVREKEPISRATIARETALQRSTISEIVEALTGEGLVEEGEGKSTGGRRPTLLRLRTVGAIAIGVNITPTYTSAPNFATLIERALDGEQEAKAALTETARYLGIGISNLVVGFSPEAVIVGGAITQAWPLIEAALTEKIERSVRRGLPSARILRSTLNGDPTLMGALSLVLASKFAGAATA